MALLLTWWTQINLIFAPIVTRLEIGLATVTAFGFGTPCILPLFTLDLVVAPECIVQLVANECS